MWVVKLGGSLAARADLDSWFDLCADHLGQACIVPGGGVFADAVRAVQSPWGLDRDVGHELAVMAMEMYGHFLCRKDRRLRPAREEDEIRAILKGGGVPVWFASSMLARAEDRRVRDWQMTSDSLAVWLARRWGARGVLLVKSAALPEKGRIPLAALQQSGVIDMGIGALLRPGLILRCVAGGRSRQAIEAWSKGQGIGAEVIHG